MSDSTFNRASSSVDNLLSRELDPHRPSLENRVAYQWEAQMDLLGYRHATRRDNITLKWLGEAVYRAKQPAAVLDIGCAYGNLLLMLNAFLGKPPEIQFVGIDLYAGSLEYAKSFSENVPGYKNCKYQVADLTRGLPFKDATFDAVSLCDVLEHIEKPAEVLKEVIRVAKPGATVVLSTPLRDSLFKKLASMADYLAQGRLYKAYYRGKETKLDDAGKPIMETHAGHAHISEMNYKEMRALFDSLDLKIEDALMMPIMSGSWWFDKHKFLLPAILFFEALHDILQFPSWAHSVCLKLKVPDYKV